jgi:hypothetical protein
MRKWADATIELVDNVVCAVFLIVYLVFLIFVLWALWSGLPSLQAKEPPIVIRLDLTPVAMRACAEAFIRFGFWSVQDYECRVEKGAKGVVVALYGPGADGKAGEKKRLGEVPLGR